jgi:LuxR family maltose regulon positive regulatory protein
MADSLPHTMLLDRPRMGLYQAWYCITQGRIAEAVPLLQGMAQQLAGGATASGQPWMQAWIASALAFLAAPSGASESAALPDYRLLEAIPATDPILRNAADLLYGMTLGRREDLDGAVAIAIKCIQRENKPHGAASIPTLAPFLTRLYLMQGRLHATVSLCREYLEPIEKRGIRFVHTAGSMKIDLGEALYEWNSLEEAEQHIRDGLQDNEPWQNIMTAGLGLVALARVLQAKGDHAGAKQAVAKLEDRMRADSHPREFDEALRTLRVRVQLASGDLRQASAWADQVIRRADFAQHEVLYRPTLARIRLAEGSYAAVVRLLSGPVPAPRIGSRLARQLETELLLAAALAGQQRLPEAFARIASALAQGEPEGYIRTFLDVGEPARDLLAAYLRSNTPAHAGYAQKIVDAFSSAAQADTSAGEPIKLLEPLTGRELEVLELIALGRTNKEIAQQLIIAPGTVKAHTASIYRKLDVANRTEAATRARQIGLLS